MPGGGARAVIPLLRRPLASAAGNPVEFRNPPPLALYVHVPWCVQKCPYCDFNSHALPAGSSIGQRQTAIPESDYLTALIADLESALPLVWGRRVDSVFIGGGTPSLLSGEGVDQFLAAVRSRLPLLPNAEITLEANPGTVEAGKFAAFRAAGVNRLSLGIQSFNPRHLTALGRIHDDREARLAIGIAASHFDNFNLDLMYGLPGQTLAEALADVDAALACAPPHLSCYQLTIEANTAFAVRPPALPDPDTCADMQDAIETKLAAAGYRHYEISAFARAGQECRHNLNYWQFGDYLGIGAGAHSKLSFAHRIVRQVRHREPRLYMERAAAMDCIASSTEVPRADLPFEFMLNALRLKEGFPLAHFLERTGLPLSAIAAALDKAETAGLVTRDLASVVPTERGFDFLNDLQSMFLPANAT